MGPCFTAEDSCAGNKKIRACEGKSHHDSLISHTLSKPATESYARSSFVFLPLPTITTSPISGTDGIKNTPMLASLSQPESSDSKKKILFNLLMETGDNTVANKSKNNLKVPLSSNIFANNDKPFSESEHLERIESARSKLQILLSENCQKDSLKSVKAFSGSPPSHQTSSPSATMALSTGNVNEVSMQDDVKADQGAVIRKSLSVPLTPSCSKSELGKRTSSDGGNYKFLLVKKRQNSGASADGNDEESSRVETISSEFLRSHKRLKNDLSGMKSSGNYGNNSDDSFNAKNSFPKRNLLFNCLQNDDDDVSDNRQSLLKSILCEDQMKEKNKRCFDEERTVWKRGSNNAIEKILMSNKQPMERSRRIDTTNPLSFFSKSSTVSTLSGSPQSSSASSSSSSLSSSFSRIMKQGSEKSKTVSKKVRLIESANQSILIYLNKVVNFALSLPNFNKLSPKDQKTLLVSATPKLLLIHIASENFQLETVEDDSEEGGVAEGVSKTKEGEGPTVEFVEGLKRFIKRCHVINVNQTEFFYLKLIALYRHSGKLCVFFTLKPIKTYIYYFLIFHFEIQSRKKDYNFIL